MIISAILTAAPLLMHPVHEPSLMDYGSIQEYYDNGSGALDFMDCHMAGGFSSWTAVAWMRCRSSSNGWMTSEMFFSVRDARPTTLGGASLHNRGGMGDWTNVTLDASGTWSMGSAVTSPRDTGLDEFPSNAPAEFSSGIWCVNVISNESDITLTVAGEELHIPATNRFVQNVMARAQDTEVTASGFPGSSFRLGIGELIPVRFYQRINGVKSDSGNFLTEVSVITNEWLMLSFRCAISNGTLVTRDDLLRWTHDAPTGKTRILGDTMSETFETGWLMQLGIRGLSTDPGARYDIWGLKFFRGWLSDDEVETVRDLDEAEMKRRGIRRWNGEGGE